MIHRKRKIGFLLFVSMLGFSGCKLERLEKMVQNFQKNSVSNSSFSNEPQSAENPYRHKLSQYVGCYNQSYRKVENTEREYLYYLKGIEDICKTGQTQFPAFPLDIHGGSGGSDVFGLYTLAKTDWRAEGSVKACKQAASITDQSPAIEGLDDKIADYAKGYSELAELAAQARDYHEQQNYKDDGCSKGREIYSRILPTIQRLRGLEDPMKARMEQIKKWLDQQLLVALEKKEGRKFSWHILNFSMSTTDVIHNFPTRQISAFNSQNFLRDFPLMDKAYNDMTAYAQNHPDEVQAIGGYSYPSFERVAKDYYVSSKLVYRDVTAGVQPKVDQLNNHIEKYNKFIEEHNQMTK